ncbi:MAG: 4Fe-4S binding protein [Oscillospiraceae bacterium]|jgi:indolepyruvate ferredoxin oxidoreductase alpha subunit|nr:4Fe-4S binding protein [Oscillospiraceae bacterium]
MQKQILSGNEAVARGAWEVGVKVAAAYPGTPSTEILENLSAYKNDLYATWANNEKIAAEIAYGAAVGGLRALAAMKHVGMNAAADPIFSAAYTGINAGMVVISADDPGCYSSQNEQDNRLYAQHAKLIMLEPSDSQECLDFVKAAFELSEQYDMLVLLRLTTRVCHSKSIVSIGERGAESFVKPYNGDPRKYAMLPVNAKARHIVVEKNISALANDAKAAARFNRTEYNPAATVNAVQPKQKVGVITSGMAYQHAREAFGDKVSYLKLGLTYPLNREMIEDFACNVDSIWVIEEGESYLRTQILAMGIEIHNPLNMGSKGFIQGELSAARIREALAMAGGDFANPPTLHAEAPEGGVNAPARPPVMCAGCPHRGFFRALSKRKDKLLGVGDIGCYTLGVNAPFNGMDITLCMGSGFSIPIGLSKALEAQGDPRKVIGFCGDSTFFHSGFSSLTDAVHQKANVVLAVLDNSITAMTGHQENAGTERNLMGYEVPKISIEKMILSTGIPEANVFTVDPIDQKAMLGALDSALAVTDGTAVIITKRPCALLKEVVKVRGTRHCEVDAEKCVGCKSCMKTACPVLAFDEGKKTAYVADTASCTACGLCAQQCKFNAIGEVE